MAVPGPRPTGGAPLARVHRRQSTATSSRLTQAPPASDSHGGRQPGISDSGLARNGEKLSARELEEAKRGRGK
jgi:hypothetical protein